MNAYDVKHIVDNVVEHLKIESVSDMTVDQLTILIAESIHSTITSRDYAEEIDRMLAQQIRRNSHRH